MQARRNELMRLSMKTVATVFCIGVALIPSGLYLYWQANQARDGLETKLSQATPFTEEYYALEGSLKWWRNATASTYWPISLALIATGIIILSASSAYCVFRTPRSPPSVGDEVTKMKDEVTQMRDQLAELRDGWRVYDLGDGSKIKVKMELKGAKRLNRYTEDGNPIYTVDVKPIVQVVYAPEEFRKQENTS